MSAMTYQITSVSLVYSTVCSGSDKKNTPKLRVSGLCEGNSPVTGEFPTQRASNAQNDSIWWRHHVIQHSWSWSRNTSREICLYHDSPIWYQQWRVKGTSMGKISNMLAISLSRNNEKYIYSACISGNRFNMQRIVTPLSVPSTPLNYDVLSKKD